MPRSRALWIAAMESLSSCGPQAKAQSPPPMAHAPKPMGERWSSELPSCFLSIAGLDARVGSEASSMRENSFAENGVEKQIPPLRYGMTTKEQATANEKNRQRQMQKR